MKKIQHYEDYEIGMRGEAERPITGRTVTDADIVGFACITEDYYEAHLNAHYAAHSQYGRRIAHGLLGCTFVTGLLNLNSPHILGRGIPGAYFYSFEVNYRDAIRIDDTVSLDWQIVEKTDFPGLEGYGQVKTAFQLINQDEKMVYEGTVVTLFRKASAANARLLLKAGIPWEVPAFEPDPDKIYCVEDFPIGYGGETEGRTITEADIVNFAGLSGDWDPLYMDAVFAEKNMFGERIAHGMLIFNIGQGKWTKYFNKPNKPRTGFAGHLRDKVTFLYPVKIGDTIRCRYRTADTRISRSRPGAGIITTESQVINQRGEVVQEATVLHLETSRPVEGGGK